MTRHEHEELILLYAAGGLDAAQEREVRAHLASGCLTCAAKLAEAREILGDLALAAPGVTPSAIARSKLMERLAAANAGESGGTTGPERAGLHLVGQAEKPVPRKRANPWLTAIIGGAFAASVVIFVMNQQMDKKVADTGTLWRRLVASQVTQIQTAVTVIHQEQDKTTAVKSELVALRDKYTEAQGQLQQTTADLKQARDIVNMLKSPKLEMVDMNGSGSGAGNGPGEGPAAHLLWDKNVNAWVVCAMDMKPNDAKSEYELWAITANGKKMKAGMFSVDDHGYGMLDGAPPDADGSKIAAVAVTLEPRGGSDQPTSPVLLVGKVE